MVGHSVTTIKITAITDQSVTTCYKTKNWGPEQNLSLRTVWLQDEQVATSFFSAEFRHLEQDQDNEQWILAAVIIGSEKTALDVDNLDGFPAKTHLFWRQTTFFTQKLRRTQS